MSTKPASVEVVPSGNYGETRFNALRHGVLSRYTVLPWEDEAEYRALLAALVAEQKPEGPHRNRSGCAGRRMRVLHIRSKRERSASTWYSPRVLRASWHVWIDWTDGAVDDEHDVSFG